MTAQPGDPRPATVLAVIGPPGPEVSSVAGALARRYDGQVLALADLTEQRGSTSPAIAAAVRDTSDPLGHIPGPLACRLMRSAVLSRSADTLVLDGYPATAVQAEHLLNVLRKLPGHTLAVLELVPDKSALRRALLPTTPGPIMPGWRNPAGPTPGLPARYRQRAPMLRFVLERHGVPRHVAESHLSLGELLDAADHAFGHLLPERIPERAAS
ncbi:nucleoside monophosphate kinase [Streptomyces sp. RKAG337]|uniref:nucleoside monophosphate kinase n=1 Tax=Streptomyces sp. RKAG337 TaxID=2893404 RepID=UPI0035A9720C